MVIFHSYVSLPEGKSYFHQVFQRLPTWDFDDGVPRDSLPEFCPQFWNGRKSLERGDNSGNLQILREISSGFSGSMGTACPCWSHGFFEAFDSLQNPSTILCRCSAAGKATTAGVSGWNPPVHHLVPYEMAMKWQSYHVLESQNSLFGIYLGVLFCFKDVSKSFYILQDCEFFPIFWVHLGL